MYFAIAIFIAGIITYRRGRKMIWKYKSLDRDFRQLTKNYLDLRVSCSGNLLAKARIEDHDGFAPYFQVVRGSNEEPEVIKRVSYTPENKVYIRNYCEDLTDKINEEP